MKKYVVYLVVIFVLFFTVIMFFVNENARQVNYEKNDVSSYLMRNIILQYKSIYERIRGDSIVNILNGANNFDTLISESKKLVVYIPRDVCSDCLNSELPKIRSLSNKIGVNKIVFLTQFSKVRESKLWKNKWNINFDVYNNQGSSVFSEIEENNTLSLFVLDSIMIPQHLFLPISFMSDLSVEYYKFVETLLVSCDTTKISNKSRITFSIDNEKQDLGNIKLNNPKNITFLLKNESEEPLVITKIETTCGCTIPSWDKSPVLPGGIKEITVLYKAEKLGVFRQKIFVFSNTEKNPRGLLILGNVVK